MTATVAAPIIKALLALAEERGVDVGRLTEALGLESEVLRNPLARVPVETLHQVLVALVRETGDETIGLHAGAMANWGTLPEYIARNSPTMGAAIERTLPYIPLIADTAEIVFTRGAKEARIRGRFPLEQLSTVDEQIVRLEQEGWLVGILALLRELTGQIWVPLEVRFRTKRPASTAALETMFRAPLRFDCDATELVLDATLLDLPILRADSNLGSILVEQADSLLASLPGPDTTSSRVGRAVLDELAQGEPSVDRIAKRFGMSGRTLQRRLADEGTSHQEILDATRHKLALRYLEKNTSLTETALKLGYSDSRAFKRAFRRWTGCSPAEHRRMLRSQGHPIDESEEGPPDIPPRPS